jgi:phosphoglycolate phosphatase
LVTIQCGQQIFTNVSAILFDKDGTLANSESFLLQVGYERLSLLGQQFPSLIPFLTRAFGIQAMHPELGSSLETNGQALDPAGLLAVGSRRDCEIAAAAAITTQGISWIQALKLAQDWFREAEQRLPRKATITPVLPGAEELLRSLKKSDVKVGVLSADTLGNIHDFLATYQLQSYVQLSIGIDSGPPKPDPQLVLQACRDLNVLPAQTLMIGDSEADVTMARAAQVQGAIGINFGWRTTLPDLPDTDQTLTSFKQLQILAER